MRAFYYVIMRMRGRIVQASRIVYPHLPFSGGGKNRASDLRKRALDLMGKKEDRGSPVLIPSI